MRAEIKLTDAAIRKQLAVDNVTEVRDSRYPLLLRFNRARTGGSWHLVTYQHGNAIWRQVGSWPTNGAKSMVAEVDRLTMEQRSGGVSSVDSWVNCSGLLRWYKERALSDRSLSAKRKENIKCTIDKHLVPLLGNVALDGVDRQVLDELLLWPLQQTYELGSVRQYFSVLKKAFKQAATLRRIAFNPLADIKFSDFTDAKINAKGAKLQPKDLSQVLELIASAEPNVSMLLLLMLALGTRIGETRQLKWQYLDFAKRRLTIPAPITKTQVEHVLPLSEWLVNVLIEYREQVGGEWLFAVGDTPMSSRHASMLVRSVSDGKWSAHDLRKLARTSWADLGVDYMVAEQLLNHAMSKLDQAYIHTYMETQKRSAIDKWHSHLQAVNSAAITKIMPRLANDSDDGKAA